MQSNTLKARTPRTTSMRVGRGGKRGKTSGRGTKGQNARAGHKKRPEMRDLIKKMPKLRGHGKNRARTVRIRTPYVAVNLATLEHAFESGAAVTAKTLFDKGIISSRAGKVQQAKILGTGTLTKSLSLSGLAYSATAKAAIEKAGGTVL